MLDDNAHLQHVLRQYETVQQRARSVTEEKKEKKKKKKMMMMMMMMIMTTTMKKTNKKEKKMKMKNCVCEYFAVQTKVFHFWMSF